MERETERDKERDTERETHTERWRERQREREIELEPRGRNSMGWGGIEKKRDRCMERDCRKIK